MHQLVDLKKACPGIQFEIAYATESNFLKRVVYPNDACFLMESAAQRLKKVQENLKKGGLGLKVFDGYRPFSVQKIFWDFLPDARYIADPKEGSKHNRGSAVDLTLIDAEGKELTMPTPFDDFTEKAHRDYFGGSQKSLANRQLLEDVMTAEGFLPLPTEWWHFDDPDWEKYPILDIGLDELCGGQYSFSS